MSQEQFACKRVKAVILAGRRSFGRCPVAVRLPTALWPVAGQSVLERLLRQLAGYGIKQAVICCDDASETIRQSVSHVDEIEVSFLEEALPLGTAGSLRQVPQDDPDTLLLVLHVGLVSPPPIGEVMMKHQRCKSDLSVVLHPKLDDDELESESAGVYLCESSVLDFIPKEGYCDIKETLIPALLKAGKEVSVIRLAQSVEGFRDWTGYLRAIAVHLDRVNEGDIELPLTKSHDSGNVWISPTAKIDKTVRIYGPVVIGDGTKVAEEAVILGPVMIGRNVTIEQNSMISDSVLWDGAQVGAECEIQKSLIDNDVCLSNGSIVQEQIIPYTSKGVYSSFITKTFRGGKKRNECAKRKNFWRKPNNNIVARASGRGGNEKPGSQALIGLGIAAILGMFLWSHWPTISDLWRIWMQSDEYSSGLLVPIMAVYIAWSRRATLARCRIHPSIWGLFAFLVAQALRLFGMFFMYASAERLSLVVSIGALVLLLFGWSVFRKSFTILLFLALMLPLPKSLEARITLPLQSIATSSAVFSLETLGCEVLREGNVIHLGETTVAVAEACNGLRMVTSFFVISGLVILLVRRAWWEKLILLLSTLPIGLFCNTVRLTITSLAFTVLEGERWEIIFHDFGGYAMMPLALAIVVLELWVLAKAITVPAEVKSEVLLTRSEV